MGNSAEVLKLLARLRDTPVNTEEMDTRELTIIYKHLMDVPNSLDGVLHWFCSRAQPDIVETASFCIRMFAYDSVAQWREKLWECVGHCADCVQGMEQAKVTSRRTYFGAYQDHVLTAFYSTMDAWELGMVIGDLTKAGLLGDAAQSSKRTLANIDSAVPYRMVSNWTIFRDPRILSVIKDRPPPGPLPKWPKDPLPPGMLMLLLHEKADVRHWAEAHASQCTVIPMSSDHFFGAYLDAVEAIGRQFTDRSLNANLSFPFVTNATDLWSGLRIFLRQIPVDALSSPSRQYSDFRGIVTRHLYDTGARSWLSPQIDELILTISLRGHNFMQLDFLHIFQCLLLLLKRTREKFWVGEGPEFPQLVFDSVKDNRSYIETLQNVKISTDRPWFLAWFPEFLHTITDSVVYKEILAKIIDFLCEEAQHERFKDARPMIMLAGTRLFASVVRKYQADENFAHAQALHSTLDIHGDTFLSVAFAKSYQTDKWQHARDNARVLVLGILDSDIYNVSRTIQTVTGTLAQNLRPGEEAKQSKFHTFSIRDSTWMKLYATIQPTDSDGIASLINLVARTCHIDTLNVNHFSQISSIRSADGSQTAEDALTEVNRALSVFRDGFPSTINAFADFNTSSVALDLLRRPGVVRDLMKVSLSPIEDLQVAAQVLVGLAFDVDARQECFRAMLENVPGEAFEGILDFLTTFKGYAPVMPEACNLSKSLVRCFSDILDVLSASPNGLLHSARFLNPGSDKGPAANLINIWKLMTKSFTVILRRTPSWALYFEPQEMVVWMRDALIFGRDMLATWRIIEQAANSRQPAAIRESGKLSPIGKEMATGLQEVLLELTRWLRLTDEELLHQSFALLTSLLACFRDAGLSPTDETTKRLRKFIDSPRQNADPSQVTSRLDPTRLLALEAALDDFEDVVEIVAPPASAPTPRLVPKAKVQPLAPKDKAKEQRYIVTSSSKSKTVPSLTARSSITSLKSQYFTERDQEKIDADISLPTFRKSSKSTVPAKQVAGPSRSSTSGPKFEGHASAPQQESSSSESESDSEDDGQPGGLARLAKLQRTPKIKKPVERRQIMTMDLPIQRNAMQERLARRDEIRNAAIRLNPNIGELHRAVLSWDYQHSGPYPPGPKNDYVTIPGTFNTYDEYRKVWEPLLLLDIWAQVLSSKQEDQETHDIKITSRQFSDQWLDVEISFTGSIKKDWYLSDTDLVLLKHQGSQKCIMAKTLSYRSIPFGSQQGTQASIRCFAKNDPGLQMNTAWKLSKVMNLTTVQREYASLVAVPYYDHFSTILNPRLPHHPDLKEKDIHEIMTTYRVNEPQAKAILNSLHSNGFVLIQGPPGTGKTSTICSLIAASLAAKKPQIIVAGRGGPATKASAKILLCAPSNAAIDEIAARLHSGNFGGKPAGSIKVVRIGAKQAMNASVQEISLDNLVEVKLANDGASSDKPHDTSSDIATLQHEIEALKLAKTQKEQEKENTHDNGARKQALIDEISQLRTRQTGLVRELNRRRDQNKSKMRDLEAKRRTFRLDVVQESDVICTTLSGSANDLLGRFDFEMVIIDEAAQCVELSSLIPLKYRSNRCVMVGDPQQLPPTVISTEACRFKYNESLFVRLQKQRPEVVHLLSIQYRMHPEISRLPSRAFYQGRLLDGPQMDVKTKQPWHSNPKFGTYRFFNVAAGIEESDNRKSLKNMAECKVAVALYARLIQEYSSIDFSYRVGIVTMYRAQIVELRRAFEARFGQQVLDTVDFNTVDGFQGQEKDIIILSCVRSGKGLQAIGFLTDDRRMNVALTRAKSSLFILGNAPTLERSDDTWKDIVADARTRSSLINTDPSFFTTSSTVHPAPPQTTPVKMSKSAAPSAPLPSDLVTPRNYKSIHQVSGPSKIPQSNEAPQLGPKATILAPPSGPQPPNNVKPLSITGPEGSSLGRKRPGDSIEPSTNPDPDMKSSKPRPPSTKRQKQTSIFIPKPSKKRPPDDVPSGPQTNKRRI